MVPVSRTSRLSGGRNVRRFYLEHRFHFLTQTLNWTVPRVHFSKAGRSLDLADSRCLHPTAADAVRCMRSAPAEGTADAGSIADALCGPPNVSDTLCSAGHACRPAETRRPPAPVDSGADERALHRALRSSRAPETHRPPAPRNCSAVVALPARAPSSQDKLSSPHGRRGGNVRRLHGSPSNAGLAFRTRCKRSATCTATRTYAQCSAAAGSMTRSAPDGPATAPDTSWVRARYNPRHPWSLGAQSKQQLNIISDQHE